MHAIRLVVCLALVIVPAAGLLSALRTRSRDLVVAAVFALIASVAIAGFTLHSGQVAPTGPGAPAPPAESLDPPDAD